MRNRSTWLLLAFVPVLSCAGEALIIGTGQVITEPDYMELNIQLTSQCYASPEAARKSNDLAARQVIDFLNKKISGAGLYNKVISLGGYTSPYNHYQKDNKLCQNTFQKTNTITLRTQQVSGFESTFDEIQKFVLKQYSEQQKNKVESAVTFASLSEPVSLLSDEKRSALEQEALGKAFVDAKLKLGAILKPEQMKQLKLVDISELPPDRPRPFVGAKMMALANDSAPVQVDQSIVDKTIYFRFTFQDVPL